MKRSKAEPRALARELSLFPDYCTRPPGLNVSVRLSLSLPIAPSGRPLWLSSTPPAFPVVMTMRRLARTRRWLSAFRNPSHVFFPSAVSETHASSFALINTTNVRSGVFTGGGVGVATGAAVSVPASGAEKDAFEWIEVIEVGVVGDL